MKLDSPLANVIMIGSGCVVFGVGAQIGWGFVSLFAPTPETAEEKQIYRIAEATAGAVAGAISAWVGARRQIKSGNLKASASPIGISLFVAGGFALSAIVAPFLFTLAGSPRRHNAGDSFWDERGYASVLTIALSLLAVWLGLRLRRESAVDFDPLAGTAAMDASVAVDGNQFTSPLGPKQREIAARALTDLDAIDVQFTLLRAHHGDPAALAAYSAITACASGFKPLLPDDRAKFRRQSECAPLPQYHHVPTSLEHACAAYRDAAMILMLVFDKDPAAAGYIREVATRLGVGDDAEQATAAAVGEARRQRNLAAAAAELPSRLYAGQ